MDLAFTTKIRILKPAAEVFQAVHDPAKLSGYFTNGGASAPLDAGTTVQWAFEDTPGQKIGPFPVKVLEVEPDKKIVFEWEGVPGHDTRVEMTFEPIGEDTIVSISETGWRENQKELDHSYMNCQGWMQFLSALKGFTEYGINLRKGAYDGVYTNAEQSAKA